MVLLGGKKSVGLLEAREVAGPPRRVADVLDDVFEAYAPPSETSRNIA
jgi:hypothetical protein